MIQQCNTHGILTNTSQKEMGSSPEFRREFHGPRVLHTQPLLTCHKWLANIMVAQFPGSNPSVSAVPRGAGWDLFPQQVLCHGYPGMSKKNREKRVYHK